MSGEFEDYGGFGDGSDEDQNDGQQSRRHSSSKGEDGDGGGERRQNPRVAFYKPRKNFDPKDSKSIGSALQVDLSLKSYGQRDNCCYLSMAPQCAEMGEKVVFDWKNRKIAFKLSTGDISNLLAVTDMYLQEAVIFHQSGNKDSKTTSVLSFALVGAMPALMKAAEEKEAKKYEFFCKQLSEGKMQKHTGHIRLTKSGDGNSKSQGITLTPVEVVQLREFLKYAIAKIFDA